MEVMTWAFIGTIIGAIASIATTIITNWSSYLIVRQTKGYERKEIANTFQRQTIIELQVELLEYIRSCYQAYLYDCNQFKKTGEWGGKLPEDLNTKNRELSAKTSILIQRISNNELRDNLLVLKDSCARCTLSKKKSEADELYAILSEDYQKSNELLGMVLRSTYQ
ncbi:MULTISPECIES: hypothetical protein [Photobacterium]|uniref:Uncharacterized protein n=1 Tax=Photobacterium iliopiscarium TaxID=56192 RepID=A0A2T3M7R3_9GAMM|nr:MULTISPECIES: hypothetical protein [Photobacterium]MCD9481546.1 hypothetical protein [Photobacterium phosphoreum]PSU33493.1 hypothetical protein CTM85_19310 [Photobacterium phosphoreum]PSU55466.1 hypothetical protein CTM80_19980 [Photobacterium phosphoreum]PSV88403.1 hypothetical protein C9I88_19815 [Photobacterium iliopiscarium]